ncbi:MAG TPA: VTT domain-containing protein [Candidatus Acidoferrum sp.]|nr:VTT domain-containing protein [Candidatus Acidoferrum sp.]
MIPLGLLDSSVIPLPGSMDFAVVLLSARDKPLWFYYAAMATTGSVLGALLTYRIARKGGKEALAKKLSKRKADRVLKAFERWGLAAIAIPALLPPPFPFVPFVIAAGAMQYSLAKFLAALSAGRAVRYTILAWLGVRYGRHILSLFSRHAYAALAVGLGVVLATVIIGLLFRNRR